MEKQLNKKARKMYKVAPAETNVIVIYRKEDGEGPKLSKVRATADDTIGQARLTITVQKKSEHDPQPDLPAYATSTCPTESA